MLLYIVRHGIAIDREDPKCPSDPERYLTAEGTQKTKEVAKSVAKIIDSPKLFISSPYVRAVQTGEIFAEALEFSKAKIEKSDLLKSVESVMCFGHAPHLDELVSAALGAKKDVTELKKAGVACVDLSRVHAGAGKLLWLITPGVARKLCKGK